MRDEKDQKKRGSKGTSRPKKILSGETSPLWMRLGHPSSGPEEIALHCRDKALDKMPTSEVVSDTMNFVAVLAWRAKQKCDREAVQDLVFTSKTINRLLEGLEQTHSELFKFASQQSEWPVNLSPKKQTVTATLKRLLQLGVGTNSTPPTSTSTRIEAGNWATQIAAEIIRRLEAFRFNQRRKKKASLPPLLASLYKSRFTEFGEMPDVCADLHKLRPLGPTTWKSWWQPYGAAVLDALLNQHSALYVECINLKSEADEVKDASESVRLNYAKRHIKQAFGSIAKNPGKSS